MPRWLFVRIFVDITVATGFAYVFGITVICAGGRNQMLNILVSRCRYCYIFFAYFNFGAFISKIQAATFAMPVFDVTRGRTRSFCRAEVNERMLVLRLIVFRITIVLPVFVAAGILARPIAVNNIFAIIPAIVGRLNHIRLPVTR